MASVKKRETLVREYPIRKNDAYMVTVKNYMWLPQPEQSNDRELVTQVGNTQP